MRALKPVEAAPLNTERTPISLGLYRLAKKIVLFVLMGPGVLGTLWLIGIVGRIFGKR